MRIIFLNTDGSIFNSLFQETPDPECVAQLNRIYRRFDDLWIVLTSDWRHDCSLSDMASKFEEWGIMAPVIGATGIKRETVREEILRWILANPMKRSAHRIIVDVREDSDLFGAGHLCPLREVGLTEESAVFVERYFYEMSWGDMK